jgi:hypothetical protein
MQDRCLRLLLALPRRLSGCRTPADSRRFTGVTLSRSSAADLGTENLESLCPGLVERNAQRGEDLGGNSLLFSQQSEKKVLGPHIGVAQFTRLRHRELENLLRS